MKTKVICAALLAMFAIGMSAQANPLTAGKANGKTAVVAKHKAVNKKKIAKPGKPAKKAKAGKKGAANTARPTK